MAVVQFQPASSENRNANFFNRFSSDEQHRLLSEDLNAGITVSMVLFGVLTFGLLGMILSVVLTI